MTGQVTPEQLARVPVEHRELIARWLLQRAEAIEPSFVLSVAAAFAIKDVVAGAAVDLADPLAEASTTGHAGQVIARLMGALAEAEGDDHGPAEVVVRHVPPDHFRATGGVDG